MRNLARRSAPREPARRLSHILGPVSVLGLLTRLRVGRPEPSFPGRAPNVVRAGKPIHSPVSGVARCVCGGTRRHHPGPSRPSQRTAGLLDPPHIPLGPTPAARRCVHPPPGRRRARQPTVHRLDRRPRSGPSAAHTTQEKAATSAHCRFRRKFANLPGMFDRMMRRLLKRRVPSGCTGTKRDGRRPSVTSARARCRGLRYRSPEAALCMDLCARRSARRCSAIWR